MAVVLVALPANLCNAFRQKQLTKTSTCQVSQHPADSQKPCSSPIFPSWRLAMYTMCFLGVVSSLLLRVSINEALVAMINNTITEELFLSNGSSPGYEERCYSGNSSSFEHTGARNGEFSWSRQRQATVIAAFYYGYILTLVPSGRLADHFGGKWMMFACILLQSIISFLSPVSATFRYELLVLLRAVSGALDGGLYPCLNAMWARWSPPKERSLAVSLAAAGSPCGVMVSFLMSGVLCDRGFAGGWPAVFYISGMIGCGWSLAWMVLCYNSPSEHPFISAEERSYLESELMVAELQHSEQKVPTPWCKILSSPAVWSLSMIVLCEQCTYYTLVTCIPIYFHDVLGMSMTENGLFGNLPYIGSAILTVASGVIADRLIFSQKLSVTNVRKLFCAISYVPSGICLALTGLFDCNRAPIVLAFVLGLSFLGICIPAAFGNQLDLAPSHAAVISGITITISVTSNIGFQHVIGALIGYRSTRSDWQTIFYVVLGVQVAGTILFTIFGSGKRQSWEYQNNEKTTAEPPEQTDDNNNRAVNQAEVL